MIVYINLYILLEKVLKKGGEKRQRTVSSNKGT